MRRGERRLDVKGLGYGAIECRFVGPDECQRAGGRGIVVAGGRFHGGHARRLQDTTEQWEGHPAHADSG
jgi:hypothetical protein